MPIQQMLLGAGADATKTYVDDIFSTFLYTGTGSAQNINNGINLSGEGGLVWTKSRSHARNHSLHDSARGVTCLLKSNDPQAQYCDNTQISSFNSNGFSIGTDGSSNTNGDTYSSWTFRKTKGFFDVVTWTGNGSNRTISHSLGSVPGMIIVKRTSASEDWTCYHRNLGGITSSGQYPAKQEFIDLNLSSAAQDDSTGVLWNSTAPTSTQFSLGTHSRVNGNNDTYVAYLFAGGESEAATARSVEFDGADQSLNIPDDDAWYIETNYTAECWFKMDEVSGNGWDAIFGQWQNNGANATNSWVLEYVGTDLRFYYLTNGATSSSYKSLGTVSLNQWHHFAFSKSGSSTRLFIDGTQVKATFDIGTLQNGTGEFTIGGDVAADGHFKGKISNVRITKGQALYTSSFKVTNEPLTTTSQGATASNVKLLCCNNSSPTGSTVTPGTITNNNSATASIDSPFDDPGGFVFGANGDQNVIKCGSVTLPSGESNIAAYLGFEPQWLLFKQADGTDDWDIYDAMRSWKWNKPGDGAVSVAKNLEPNTNDAEALRYQASSITSTGFHLDGVGSGAKTFIYCAIRRPDGYVGKPPELGTDVFTMDTGNSSASIPAMDSNFPVDWAMVRKPAVSHDNWAYGRLMENTYMVINSTAAEGFSSAGTFTSNVGFYEGSNYNSDYQSWMWKRHAGFDMVGYTGNGEAGHVINHSLSQTPQMIWFKRRDGVSDWEVWHHGLNGGSNNINYAMYLNLTNAEASAGNLTEMNATSFTLGGGSGTNGNNDEMISLLFASVDGICKVGYYDGQSSTLTLNLGFQPRFFWQRRVDSTGNWHVLDTTRGWGSGDDKYFVLESNGTQGDYDFGAPTSTGLTLAGGADSINNTNCKYIYYAHA